MGSTELEWWSGEYLREDKENDDLPCGDKRESSIRPLDSWIDVDGKGRNY